jgi:hypothetical protein
MIGKPKVAHTTTMCTSVRAWTSRTRLRRRLSSKSETIRRSTRVYTFALSTMSASLKASATSIPLCLAPPLSFLKATMAPSSTLLLTLCSLISTATLTAFAKSTIRMFAGSACPVTTLMPYSSWYLRAAPSSDSIQSRLTVCSTHTTVLSR